VKLKISSNAEQRNAGMNKKDKNYCCTSAAGQAILLQMHLLVAVLIID